MLSGEFDVREREPTDDVLIPGGGDPRDPYSGFAALRQECPVFKVPGARPTRSLPARDVYTLFRHDDVQGVLRNAEGFSSRIVGEMMGAVLGRTILEMDGREHFRYRSLVAQAFRPKVLARWEHTLVAPLVGEVIDDFAPVGRADLVRDFNFRFPVFVIARMLGLPQQDYAVFQRWSVALLAYAAHPQEGVAAAEELRDYLRPMLAQRRSDPRDDIISELTQAELDGERLSDDEILPFLQLLLPAGAETTYRALGNLLYGLLSHPTQLDKVRADRGLIPRAVEEALRWEPPLTILTRQATVPAVIRGVDIPAGAQVAVCQGSANRDESVWGSDADTFDVLRAPRQHLSFGFGEHMCLGMHLARLEMRVALGALLDRFPDIRLDPDGDAHIRGLVFRSPSSLPVVFTPQPSSVES